MSDSLSTPPSSPRLLDFCRLIRLPNVFSAAADILMGFWIVADKELASATGVLALLLVCSCCLYAAGIVTNDLFDLEIDRGERPTRPLPSGVISTRTAKMISFLLILVGLSSADLLGLPGVIAMILTLSILAYNYKAKRHAYGPPVMGLCRFLNVVLAMSPAIAGGLVPWTLWLVPLGNGVYITGVTYFARLEAEESSKSGLALGGLVMFLGLAVHASCFLLRGGVAPLAWLAGVLFLLFLGRKVFVAIQRPIPSLVQSAVKSAVLGLIAVDAILVLAFVSPEHAAVVAALLLPALFLGRWIYST